MAADYPYRCWRGALYISGSYCHILQDDAVLQARSHNFTYKLGGELDEVILGGRIDDFPNNKD